MKRFALVLCAFALASCGGDDGSGEPEGGATGAASVAGPSVGDFIDELQPEKKKILGEIVAESEACKGASVDDSFVLLVTARAIDAPQESSIVNIVEDEC